MKDADTWEPTKYVLRNGRLRGSGDPRRLGVGSRLAADLFAERYQRFLPLCAHGRLLDLGCGEAPLYATYRGFVTEIVTLDWAGSQHAGRHVDVVHDLDQPLPFPDASFDTVILSDVLEHMAHPHHVCTEISRLLASGGCLVGSAPFYYPIHEAPHDYYRYTAYGLRHLIEAAGLEVRVVEPVGGSLEVVADLLAKHLAQAGWPGRLLATWLQRLVLGTGRTGLGRALARRSSSHFPLGYFFVAAKPV